MRIGGFSLAAAALVLLVGAESASATVTVRLLGSQLRIEGDAANDNIEFTLNLSTTPFPYQIRSTQPITLGDGFCTTPTASGDRFVTNCPSTTPTSIGAVLSGGDDSWIDNRPNLSIGASPPDPVAINGGIGNDHVNGASVSFDDITGGDGNDRLNGDGAFDAISGGNGNDTLDDGDGNPLRREGFAFTPEDSLTGGPGDDTLLINEGDDTARGEDGNDHIVESDSLPEGGRAPFEDTVEGGLGFDRFTLFRDRPVTLRDLSSFATLFSDGSREEDVRDFERLETGRGGDVISAAQRAVTAGASQRVYDAREGPDTVVGSDDGERIVGGGGADRLFGRGGLDDIDAKEGEAIASPDEVIDCGSATTDKALIDLLDPEPVGCETVNRSAIGEGPHLSIGAVRRVRGRTYAVRVRCPRRLRHRCRGRLELALTRRGLSSAKITRYSIRAGRRRTVRVRLPRREVRRLRRLRRSRGLVRSTERGDVFGRKTTLARRQLR